MSVEQDRRQLEDVKASCLATGLRVSPAAQRLLQPSGREVLSVHEYPTTGGLTLELPHGVLVNAPFDEPFCTDASVELDAAQGDLLLRSPWGEVHVVRVLPLPGYLGKTDAAGRALTDVAMSHADRVRVSPLVGCAYDCAFCDLPGMPYRLRSAEQVLAALTVAAEDTALPPRHALISGGSPRGRDHEAWLATCEAIVAGSPLPVDVMLSPVRGGTAVLDRLVAAGVVGLSINLELQGRDASLDVLGMKHRVTSPVFDDFVHRAVELLPTPGAVRSLLLVGLEPVTDTLEGVRRLLDLGCQPVLSPFRPATGIRMASTPPPAHALLRDVLARARRLAGGLGLGPPCTACQHNTLTFPWDVPVGAAT